MAKLTKVLETALYFDDFPAAVTFYKRVMELEPMVQDDRLCAFNINGQSVFLLFNRKTCIEPVNTQGGTIPGHDGHGSPHMAFAIEEKELPHWEKHLNKHHVVIVSRVKWPLGGTSIYFYDTEKHLIELATPGVWSMY